MGIFDKAKDLLSDNKDKVADGIDKAADMADQKTGGEYSEKIDQGAEAAKEKADDLLDQDGQ
ncbi:antitoxin [Microlunatus elymi]|uniref:Antitoxin n=1 Tax=Microlunatus elymi TaxID=2596828 RepID=A0A516Q173_9ACTN|nr:antitoxin [Microlunatus elymi]QDP97166.1 antitoxin [Microlunatus elymi]